MNQNKPCRYILSDERCPYGEKCRFAHEEKGGKENCKMDKFSSEKLDRAVEVPETSTSFPAEHFKQKKCHFYLRSYCRYGDRCKYYHPVEVSDRRSNMSKPLTNSETKSTKRDTEVPRVIPYHQQARDPPPLTLGSFIRGSRVTRPHRAAQKEPANSGGHMREVCGCMITFSSYLYAWVSIQ